MLLPPVAESDTEADNNEPVFIANGLGAIETPDVTGPMASMETTTTGGSVAFADLPSPEVTVTPTVYVPALG
jgi:hypothetical protein